MRSFNEYRGKTRDGEWHYGQYIYATQSMGTNRPYHKDWIVCGFASNGGWLTPLRRYAVVENTVGRNTGLSDIYGQKIFEGDIVRVFDSIMNYVIALVVFQNGCFCVVDKTPVCKGLSISLSAIASCEVIGNMFDNPNLIEVKR